MKAFLQTNKNRIEYLDVAKGIGIMLVIFGHSSLVLHIQNVWIHSFHMPLFFIVSGMCFNEKKYSPSDFASRRFKQIMMPCIYFSLIIASVEMLIGTRQVSSLLVNLPHALWFLPILFFSQIIVDLVWIKCVKLLWRSAFVILSLALWYVLTNHSKLPYSLHSLPAAVAFVAIGNLISSYEIGWKAKWELVICLLISVLSVYILNSRLNLYENMLVHPFIATIAAVTGSCFILALSKLLKTSQAENCLIWLGRNSLVLMSIHQFFFYAGRKYIEPYMASYPPPIR